MGEVTVVVDHGGRCGALKGCVRRFGDWEIAAAVCGKEEPPLCGYHFKDEVISQVHSARALSSSDLSARRAHQLSTLQDSSRKQEAVSQDPVAVSSFGGLPIVKESPRMNDAKRLLMSDEPPPPPSLSRPTTASTPRAAALGVCTLRLENALTRFGITQQYTQDMFMSLVEGNALDDCEEVSVSLERSDIVVPWGLREVCAYAGGPVVIVDSIMPGSPIADWVASHPGNAFEKYDLIVAVNGARGNAKAMRSEMARKAFNVMLRLRHLKSASAKQSVKQHCDEQFALTKMWEQPIATSASNSRSVKPEIVPALDMETVIKSQLNQLPMSERQELLQAIEDLRKEAALMDGVPPPHPDDLSWTPLSSHSQDGIAQNVEVGTKAKGKSTLPTLLNGKFVH